MAPGVEQWERGCRVRGDAECREILFDLETALRQVHGEQGESPTFDLLVKTCTNLLRRGAED